MSGRGRESIHEREAGGKRKKGEGKKGRRGAKQRARIQRGERKRDKQ